LRLPALGLLAGAGIALAAVGLAYLGMTLIIPVDFLARSFGWLGIQRPALGWGCLGGLGGGAAGAIHGLKRARLPSAIPKVWGGGATLGAALLLASYLLGKSR
jgi:hypothetical protein